MLSGGLRLPYGFGVKARGKFSNYPPLGADYRGNAAAETHSAQSLLSKAVRIFPFQRFSTT